MAARLSDLQRLKRRVATGEFAGMSPVNIARELRPEFPWSPEDLARLVGLEVARLQFQDTMRMYRQAGVSSYAIVTAGDDLVCHACRAAAAGGPYPIKSGAKIPVKHCRSCRCTALAVS